MAGHVAGWSVQVGDSEQHTYILTDGRRIWTAAYVFVEAPALRLRWPFAIGLRSLRRDVSSIPLSTRLPAARQL